MEEQLTSRSKAVKRMWRSQRRRDETLKVWARRYLSDGAGLYDMLIEQWLASKAA